MTETEVRLTHQTLKVLRAFVNQPTRALAGSDIMKEKRIWSGTLYPILSRLEAAGWLESEWESVDPSKEGRPRKKLYRITAVGQQKALEAFRELDMAEGQTAWST